MAQIRGTQRCIVVGGGPVGLATAIALAQRRITPITVLEQAPGADHYEPTRAFTFVLNPSGMNALASIGVQDMDKAGLRFERIKVARAMPNGKVKVTHFPPKGFNAGQVPRIMLMREELTLHLAKHIAAHYAGTIQILYNCRVESIQLPVDLTAAPVTVSVAPACAASALPKAEGQAGTVLKAAQELSCRLLAGADGAASVVRQALREQHGSPEWDMTVRRSPAGDVYWKVLQLPANPYLGPVLGEAQNHSMCMLRGKRLGGRKGIVLGMWPRWQATSPRPAVTALNADHPFWQVKSPDALYAYLEASFPSAGHRIQVPNWRKLVPHDVAERYVQRRATKFWHPQHAQRLVLTTLDPDKGYNAQFNAKDGPARAANAAQASSEDSSSAVMLIGDAAHVFPPDLGLGVNAGLVDVAVLYEVLGETGDKVAAALQKYQDLRLPEHAALIRIMQRGAPYQYNQEGAFLAQKLHSANSVLRLLAAKAMPFAFSMPAGLATSRTPSPPGTAAPRTLMRDILRAADTTTRNLYIAGAGALAGAVGTGCCVSGMAFEQCVAAGTVAALGMLVCAGLAKQLTVMQQGIGQAKMGV